MKQQYQEIITLFVVGKKWAFSNLPFVKEYRIFFPTKEEYRKILKNKLFVINLGI